MLPDGSLTFLHGGRWGLEIRAMKGGRAMSSPRAAPAQRRNREWLEYEGRRNEQIKYVAQIGARVPGQSEAVPRFSVDSSPGYAETGSPQATLKQPSTCQPTAPPSAPRTAAIDTATLEVFAASSTEDATTDCERSVKRTSTGLHLTTSATATAFARVSLTRSFSGTRFRCARSQKY